MPSSKPAKPTAVYLDVTNDPAAEARLTDAPGLRQDLYRLGFRRVGLIDARVNGAGYDDALRATLDPEDAEMMIARIKAGDVTEITSVVGRTPAFGVVEWFFGALVTFETILDNGVIVETTMKPARSPRGRGASTARNTAIDPLTQFIVKLLMGKPPEWAHPNSPSAGYFVELVNTRDTDTLWRRHQERVAEQISRSHATIRPHNSLDIFRAIRWRFQETQEFKGRTVPVITLLIALPVIFLLLSPSLMGRQLTRAAGSFGLICGPLLVGVAAMLLMTLFLKFVVPVLPVPLTPLDHLVQKGTALAGGPG